jgi:chromosome partitioning protein
MRVITISNQKGGVAKTTTAISLAAALAEKGRRVLAVDLDPQSNLTMGLGVDPEKLARSVFHVLLGECAAEAAIVPTAWRGLSALPAELVLAGAEKRLYGEIGFDEILRTRLRPLAAARRFDYAVVDCPPSLGLLTVNAIAAAQTVLVPVQCEFFSARGLGQLMEIAETVREKRNPGLVLRVLPTLFDQRNRICREILAELKRAFPMNLTASVIGIDTRIRESAAAGKPITSFDGRARASAEYRALAAEVIAEETRPAAAPPAVAVGAAAGGLRFAEGV